MKRIDIYIYTACHARKTGPAVYRAILEYVTVKTNILRRRKIRGYDKEPGCCRGCSPGIAPDQKRGAYGNHTPHGV